MANKSITQLPVATPLTGEEQLPLVQNGVTKQASVSQIANVVIPGKFITNVAFDNANYMILIYYSDGSTQEIGPVPGYKSAYINGSGDLILVDTNDVPYNLGNVIGPQGPVGPQGPEGPQGPQGDPGTAATIAVGTTTTLPAGDDATVDNVGTSTAAVFNFGIPQGIQGVPGPTGPTGTAATIAVGTTTTLSPSSPATVTNSGTSSAAVFDFGIPQGIDGTAATIAIGTTTTLSPGSSATVTNSGTSGAAIFNFGIPEGQTGATGPTGPVGPGVAAGGSAGQVLAKVSSTNYDTTWISLTGLNYQGTWDAATNTPTLTSSVGTQGSYYVVSVSGSTNLNGITDWVVGDWAVFNGSVWQKIDNTDKVSSVNGYTGAVVLTYSDVGAQPAGIYVTSVGATGPIASSGGTTPTISITQATSSTDGYLTSTDWNTFNNKGSGSVTSVSGTGSVNGITLTGTVTTSGSLTLGGTLSGIGNSQLTNSSITINGSTVSLGGSTTITAANPYALTIGTGLSGTSYDGSAAVTINNTGVTSATAGTGISLSGSTGNVTITNSLPMVYPGAGIPNSTGSAWGTSYSTTGTGTVVALQTSALLLTPTLSGATVDNTQPWLNFANGSATTVAAGRMWYNGTTGSWNLGMGGGNITQQVGEELFLYGKASAAITDSPLQIVYQTGTVGASGVVTFAPTIAGITDGNKIVGVATEGISLNAFGRVTTFGVIHNITTDGAAFGETWADGDEIWYNPVTGNPTKVKPSAPNLKVSVGIVINAGSGGSGSFQVEINHGSVLGGTDSNVQLTSVANAQILTYDNSVSYWRNTDLTAGTGISISKAANGVLTVTNTSPSTGGTVTSVSGTGTVSGITLSGTVTSSGSLTLGGTLDLSSPPAIGGTTPNLITGTTITATKYVGVSGGTF